MPKNSALCHGIAEFVIVHSWGKLSPPARVQGLQSLQVSPSPGGSEAPSAPRGLAWGLAHVRD